MEVIRPLQGTGTRQGPAEWFTGQVYIDAISTGPHVRLLSVHFTPGARTAWHRHPFGQTLHVTEGAGLVQTRGGPVEPIRAGDTVFFEPDEEHWHGAGPSSFMTHLAMQEVADDGSDAVWGDQVTDGEYSGAQLP
jgi:quercetin dioxygenase-like cupin family protein